jgi:pullulanase
MKVFIDGFHQLRIESYNYINSIQLRDLNAQFVKSDDHMQFFTTDLPICLHTDDVIVINSQPYPLEIGMVTLTKEFEAKFRYDGALGALYHPTDTTFRLFSPVAKEVILVLDGVEYPMSYEEPIWFKTVLGDHDGKPYHYLVRLVDHFVKVKDPYTIACSTTDSYVIDWSKTVPIHPTPIHLKNYVDAVIYEGHVRDMTIHLDVESKGLFEGLTEYSKQLKGSVISYIKNIGMTHLQLLPVFDFEGVDDIEKDKLYNWGYNPSQFLAIEGWYSKHPDDPYDRINQFKKVINHAHKIGLGVNMDVVYNHVYQHKTFPFDQIVPGYFYRHNNLHKMTDASYCGNDIETRNYMVRKLIIDSLIHFTKHFQIDGFRFDLMGLLDMDLMLEIEKRLKAIHPSIMLYGEGWNMVSEVPNKQRPNMSNQGQFTGFAHFNDFFRNTMKGELHGMGIGYTMGNRHQSNRAMDALIGSPQLFSSPNQSINYVECHDNLTYYDKMLLSCGLEDSKFKYCQDLANHLIAIAQGVPFFHAGQEFYRTKKGVENSYNSPDVINQIDWNIKEPAVLQLKRLLKIRKRFALYRQTTYNDSVQIEKEGNLLVYRLENKKDRLYHYIKNQQGIEKLPLHGGKLIFPSQKALIDDGHIFIDQPGIYIIQIKK